MIGLLIAAFESITERGKGQVDKSKGEMKRTVQETKEETKEERKEGGCQNQRCECGDGKIERQWGKYARI